MGLSIIVGIYGGFGPDEDEIDEDGNFYNDEQFAAIDVALENAGLSQHHEPRDVLPPLPISYDMFGYGGLHLVRRLAVSLRDGKPLPEPGEYGIDDPALKEYYQNPILPVKGVVGFSHLLDHSDAEGYYLPQEFDNVLVTDPDLKIAGGWIGSSTKLKVECEALAEAMELPLDTDPNSVEFNNSGPPILRRIRDWQRRNVEDWRRYSHEAYGILALYRCAKASVESGCAIVFI